MLAIGYRPVPLQGEGKVVDIGIQRTAEALKDRDADVVLVSHDGDFAPWLEPLLEEGRRVGVLALREYTSSLLTGLEDVELFDLEDDVAAFNVPLPRVRIIPLDLFDPETFLR